KRLAPDIPTKTGIILGMGETLEEVEVVMRDLRSVDVDILTLGQYLRPSESHIPLDRYVTPAEFHRMYEVGMAMGFRHVESGPLVRSATTPGSRSRRPACDRPRILDLSWPRRSKTPPPPTAPIPSSTSRSSARC